ncbi:MAG: glycosyltransferase [Thermodesulfovibrionales bacterium]
MAKGQGPEARVAGRADIVVGIPTYNNRETIGGVVRAVKDGLARYFPDSAAALVSPDGGSTDGTREELRRADAEDGRPILRDDVLGAGGETAAPYRGTQGRGAGYRLVFAACKALGARACLVLDPDLRSIEPEWVDLLARPVLDENFDLAAPCYLTHKYDGTITSTIVYPMARALYGLRIRQPIGWDFGLSGRMVELFLGEAAWDGNAPGLGVDIWMTSVAAAEGCRVCQSFLGQRLRRPGHGAADLSRTLAQVTGSLFGLMEKYTSVWMERRGSAEVPVFGRRQEVRVEPVEVNAERMVGIFRLGVRELGDIWREVLGRETAAGLAEAAARRPFDFPDELWASVLYDLASSWHRKVMNREQMLKTLTPLYLGKVASFVSDTAESGSSGVESRLEALCLAFESRKPYLVQRWGLSG